jgi:hypothetical protein
MMSKEYDNAVRQWVPDDEEDYRAGWNAAIEAAEKMLDEQEASEFCDPRESRVLGNAADSVRTLASEEK